MSNVKIGRIYFGRKVGAEKKWEHVASVFAGRFPGKFDVAFSRPESPDSNNWIKATAIKYGKKFVLDIADQFINFALDDGYKIVGPGLDSEAEEQDAPFTGDDDVPF